jgi:uncharacterized membrane protein
MTAKWRDKGHKGQQQGQPQNLQQIVRQGLFRQQIQSSFFSGPLPSPEQLEHYERVHPGLAERIVSMTERSYESASIQTNHRIQIENKVIKHNIILSYLGWFSGYSLGAGGLVIATVLTFKGFQLGGAAAFITSIGTLGGLFFYGRRKQGEELSKKRPE